MTRCLPTPFAFSLFRSTRPPLPSKPVDQIVDEAIAAWEKVRPQGVKVPDPKTGELVDFLFLIRLTKVGIKYLNKTLIPDLCKKAGVPLADMRGNITSHRAHSTIASQLYNAREPVTLFELQEWLGHATPTATQHYAKITPLKIGYCTYDLFEQCQHRMACAKCDFYMPKQSTETLSLEGKEHLLRLLQEIPLGETGQARRRRWRCCLRKSPVEVSRRAHASRANAASNRRRTGANHVAETTGDAGSTGWWRKAYG
jgi:hypothetical protein